MKNFFKGWAPPDLGEWLTILSIIFLVFLVAYAGIVT